MTDGESTKTRDVDELLAEVDDGAADADEDQQRTSRETDQESTLRERAERVFSPRAFLVALVLSVIGVALGGFVPILGAVLRFVGVFGAGFALGAMSKDRHYLEAGLAGALVPGVGTLVNSFALVLGGVGLPVIVVAVGLGLLAGLAGHYFGRDLRDGLTREI
jgi:heme O synthase-like polyprenyltransferase